MTTCNDNWTKRRAKALSNTIDRVFLTATGRALQKGQSLGDAHQVGFAASYECVAAQLNALIHYYRQIRLKVAPDEYKELSHYEYLAEMMEEVTKYSLGRKLIEGEDRYYVAPSSFPVKHSDQ